MAPAGSPPALHIALLALLLSPAGGSAEAQSERAELRREEFLQRRAQQRIRSGGRHLDLGMKCRKQGLVSQAAAEILLAVEVSEGRNEAANRALARMRSRDDRFWRRRSAKPSRARLDAYAKKAEKIRRSNLEDQLELAAWAHRKGLADEAVAEYGAVLRALDRALDVDARGRIRTPVGRIPAEPSARILPDAVTINGQRYLRDAFLERLPPDREVFEVATEGLRTRSVTSLEEARAMHALCTALLPHLERDLGGRPTRRPTVFVLGDRESYSACLPAAGFEPDAAAEGVTDNVTMTALVCSEGLSADRVQALALHELTHVFQHGVSPTVMPSWYTEGLADTWGGQGTFGWDGRELQVGGLMSRHRIAPLLEPGGLLPLVDLLAADVLTLWEADPETALSFYAQAWALVRFLRTGAGPDVAARFEDWENACRGAALGAEAGRARNRDASAATELFLESFGAELDTLEEAFLAWLHEL